MTSELRVTTLSNATGDGPATLTNQSAAKAWNHYHQIGTTASKDSFNVSSITDLGVSHATHNFTNNMSNANYVWTGGLTNNTTTTPAGAADQ